MLFYEWNSFDGKGYIVLRDEGSEGRNYLTLVIYLTYAIYLGHPRML